ncbi:ABC transporter ATP-binding protein [Leucobacter sp. CSA1]|uniref:ABC transporter ATP-binding protein n=1 Tax=Leucobacter chromiisoli TaxID=2796471 RepID=A0A934Q758_9MICO|nr:ABC transporter ATP-binding protein [Leucobacter chromiisoli]MBK0417802.1 ABC transporter ATP-binding protein [Leucobacter chromiisoli]
MNTPVNSQLALDVSNLTVRTPHASLVSGISFHIAQGERVGLIGESGSGKSLTSLAVMGLLPEPLTASGTVHAGDDSVNLLQLSERELAQRRGKSMSMVFQEPMTALNPLMRVGRQVAEIMQIHGTQPSRAAAEKRAVSLLDDVGLPNPAEAAQAFPHQLSGGQRQRVMLAMALANDPSLLICDEPTTALDVTVQRQVLDLVVELVRKRDTGMLFITHDLAVVASVCDRAVVLNKGDIVEEGPIEQVFQNPQHPYTRGLLAASDLDARDEHGRLFTVATAAAYRPAEVAEQVAAEPAPEPVGESPAEHGGEPIIRARDLTKTYVRTRASMFGKAAEVRALRGIDFTVHAGQRFGIVGESGSGKSTLLKILSGLERPTGGQADVLDIDLMRARDRDFGTLRSQLQIVFQDPMASLDPRMRVLDIVEEPLLNPANLQDGKPMRASDRRDAVAEMLEAVGLSPDAMERFPHQFSGGQRQRISIARALVCKPRILVADEPVSALDVSVRAQVLNLLADLVDEYALTLLFVSHDLSVVKHLCDTVAVMRAGNVVETGTTAEIYENPQDDYTRQLIEATPTLHHAIGSA